MTRLLVPLCVLLAAAPSAGQDVPAPPDPELRPLWETRFAEDPRDTSDWRGEMQWKPGRLVLAPGALFDREFPGGPWTQVRLQGERSEKTFSGEVRLTLRIEDAADCQVRLRTETADAELFAHVAILAGGTALREKRTKITTLKSLEVSCRHGLAKVRLNDETVLLAEVNQQSASIDGCRLEVLAGTWPLQALVIESSERARRITAAEAGPWRSANQAFSGYAARFGRGQYREALPLAREAIAAASQVISAEDPRFAKLLEGLGACQLMLGELDDAERLLTRSLEIRRRHHGPGHPSYGTSLNNLAAVRFHQGDNAAAADMLGEALEIQQLVAGEATPQLASAQNNLAALQGEIGNYAAAERLYRQCLEYYRSAADSAPEQNLNYIDALNNLGVLYMRMGDFSRAERILLEALELRKRATGEQNAEYANQLNSLGAVYYHADQPQKAAEMMEQSARIREATVGRDHPLTVGTLGNLAFAYIKLGRVPAARELLEEVRQRQLASLGKDHPYYADTLSGLAAACELQGDLQQADEFAAAFVERTRAIYGDQHGNYGDGLRQWARITDLRGRHDEAAARWRKAVEVDHALLERGSVAQSERQQRVAMAQRRGSLDGLLANALSREQRNEEQLLEEVWRWKGAVTYRQRLYREAAANPSAAPLFAELRQLSRQLSQFANQPPTPPANFESEAQQQQFAAFKQAWADQFAALVERRELVESRVAAAYAPYRDLREPLTAQRLSELLPSETAYVDLLEFDAGGSRPATSGEVSAVNPRRYAAFITTRHRPAALVLLGEAERLAEAVVDFRRPFTESNLTPEQRRAAREAGRWIREHFWQPIEAQLEGETTVLISPDTLLGALPWPALPGRSPHTYLLEEYRLASIPLAQLLAQLLQTPPQQLGEELLVVGDVDYGDPAKQPPAEPGGAPRWRSLPGFEAELDSVRSLFLDSQQERFVTVLRGDQATERRFLELAAGHSVIHVITHGYFSDPNRRSIEQTRLNDASWKMVGATTDPFVGRWLPGLLSGLVLAGANAAAESPDDEVNDGVLRASEIESAVLPDVELVVLSACETGLGAVAGGEGLTGLQRAFHIAGARSVVASLWRVDDRATQELMTRFYRNLLEQRMGKLDALREAQLWMLRHPEEMEALGVADPAVRGEIRDLPTPAGAPAANERPRRTSPYFWAAFQLSGDWR